MNHDGSQPDSGPRIIAMLNQKGGVGKTTTTVNLGAALARSDQRVLLIDLDPQAHLTLHLGIDEDIVERTVYDLLIDDECLVEETVMNARENLDVILSEVDLAGAEQELGQFPDRQTRLRDKIATIADRYDFILLDCPPSLNMLTVNAMTLAQEIFVPMQAHFLALQGVGRLLETVGLVCRSVNPHLRVTGIILCMYEGQTTLAKEVVADLDEFFKLSRQQPVPWKDCRVFRPPIRRNIKLAEAPSFGQTIFDYEPWCPGALDYRKLASRLLRQTTPQVPASTARAGGSETTEPLVEPKDASTGASSPQQSTGGTDPSDESVRTPHGEQTGDEAGLIEVLVSQDELTAQPVDDHEPALSAGD